IKERRINIDKVLADWFYKQDLDFASLYFGEPDVTGHDHGPDSPQLKAMVQQVDRTVGYIRERLQQLRLTNRINVIMTADHGMTNVLRGEQIQEILLSKIPNFSFRDIQLDYGALGMLLPKEGKLEKVYQVLKNSHPNLQVYKKHDGPARLHYSSHPRLLPLILIIFPLHYSKGDHGYDNEIMDMKAFFRAVGPDFHSDLLVEPFDLVDVYPLMCHLLKIQPKVNDGDLEKTKEILISEGDTGGNDVHALSKCN
uniref:Ectonucleotide pyrophosphatase/phosphodiesterase 7, tandem duplicate 2 n=1 Tax=Neogobius melanostomus TaxID=47308 RepID=A0A8C6TEU8_9GOBI